MLLQHPAAPQRHRHRPARGALAQIDGIDAIKQANSDELQLIDGLAILAGNDDIYARCLDIGGAGGIVASHVVEQEMRRIYDKQVASRSSTRRCRRSTRRCSSRRARRRSRPRCRCSATTSGACGCRSSSATRPSDPRPGRAGQRGLCARGILRVEWNPAGPPAGASARSAEPHRGRVQRADHHRRLRPALPDAPMIGIDLVLPDFTYLRDESTRSRRSSSPTATRTTSARSRG